MHMPTWNRNPQETNNKDTLKVEFLEPDEEHDYTEQTLISLGMEVEHLLQSGVKLNDIAILVRKNKSIPRIADYFDKQLNYKIVSDEAFRLDASLAICMMLDALRYLSDPENRIVKAQLATNYQLQILHSSMISIRCSSIKPKNYFHRLFWNEWQNYG